MIQKYSLDTDFPRFFKFKKQSEKIFQIYVLYIVTLQIAIPCIVGYKL